MTGSRFLAGAAAVLLVAACGREPAAPAVAAGSEHVACALGQGAAFAPVCAVERSGSGADAVLVVRHPDGGFRRFSVLPGGQGLAAADGAKLAQQAIAGGLLEVRVENDAYRFAFTVTATGPKADGTR